MPANRQDERSEKTIISSNALWLSLLFIIIIIRALRKLQDNLQQLQVIFNEDNTLHPPHTI
jgi:hypothetical protein